MNETSQPENDAATQALMPNGRPPEIPEKFWDSEAQMVRVDALTKSYQELERHLGSAVKVPGEDADDAEIRRFRQAIGVPETPDAYQLELGDDGFSEDPDVNRRLHEAGFTKTQAQLVYDLARDYVGPLVQQAAADFDSERQTEKLQQHFGGVEAWADISRQLMEWG